AWRDRSPEASCPWHQRREVPQPPWLSSPAPPPPLHDGHDSRHDPSVHPTLPASPCGHRVTTRTRSVYDQGNQPTMRLAWQHAALAPSPPATEELWPHPVWCCK